jgi:putative spermidine/putrescine transport system permease protein
VRTRRVERAMIVDIEPLDDESGRSFDAGPRIPHEEPLGYGIVTGMALNSTINATGIGFTMFTIIVGHATFCIVVVYNNVIARLRRTSRSIEEASMDLGADTWQTFRYITFPVIRTALLAGGLLPFALSFDEIIVTTFTAGTQETLPIWIFNHLRLPNQRPIVNVVAVFLIVLSAAPVYVASRLSSSTGIGGSGT